MMATMSLKFGAKIAGLMTAGSVVAYNVIQKRKIVENSWTSNYTPSVPWDHNWDKREPCSLVKPSSKDGNNNETDSEKLEATKSKASRHLILIRHGQYNLYGATDKENSLTALGREQAKLTALRLKDLDLPYSHFTSSTMTRACETADIMQGNFKELPPVERCDLLREGAPIPPEPPIGSWKPEKYKFFVDGSRIEAAFRKYFFRASPSQKEDSYEIIVCHANVIRYFVCRGLQLPPEAWLRMSLHNGSLTYMSIRPNGRVSLRQLGECGYMPPDKLSLS